jgi:hypothetical protein
MFSYNEHSSEYGISDNNESDSPSPSYRDSLSYDIYSIPIPPPLPSPRKQEWELNAASELTDLSDQRTGSAIINKVLEYYKQSNIKVLSHSALETNWNPIIHLKFEGVTKLNTKLLGTICSVTDPDDVTLDISDVGAPLKSTLDVSFCQRSLLSVYKRTDRVYGKTIYVDTNKILSTESIKSQLLSDPSRSDTDVFPETFADHDIPIIKRIVKEVHNMEMFMPVLHLSITYKPADNRYVISFNGIRTIAMSFIEHLIALCNNRIADIVVSASGTEERRLDVHILPYGHKCTLTIRTANRLTSTTDAVDSNNNNTSNKRDSKGSIVSSIINMFKRSKH